METDGRRPSGSLTEQVVGRLTALIESGALLPGAKLPSEGEMVRREGVSRTVVREAISRLQAAGLAETRHGVGSFVSARVRGEGLELKRRAVNTAADILAIYEIRIAVETEASALAATRRTRPQLRSMAAAMEDCMKEIQAGHGGADADYQFHLEMTRAAHSPYFLDILTALGSSKAIARSRFQIDERETQRQEYRKRISNEHEDIYSAILRGDPEASRAAVRNHLGNSRESMKRAV